MGGLRPRLGHGRRALVLTLAVLLGAVLLVWTALTVAQRAGLVRGGGWPAPHPDRPVVNLTYAVASDLRSATGRERIEFRPDRRICELVWRAWPNKPITASSGNSLVVTQVRLGSPVPFTVQAAGAPQGQPGTLIEVPLPQCVAAGELVAAELDFTVTLGVGTDERTGVSRSGQVAWFGTAFPLLAWERGRGWARDEAVPVIGETATSEDFRLESLRVSAPSGFAVAGVGQLVGTTQDATSGTTTHEYSAEALRDVTVTVGRLDELVRQVDDVQVHLVAPRYPGRLELHVWADQVEAALRRLQAFLGPFPYRDLWVSVLPDQTEGIEFPSAVQLGRLQFPADGYVVTHELAHQYFYALVGNNQAKSPWLDESVTTLVQKVVDDPNQSPPLDGRYPAWVGHRWGQSMAMWRSSGSSADSNYSAAVYSAGPDALLRARRAVGAASFDAALRQYLHDNAHAIATPADFAGAFQELPPVVDALHEAQALSNDTPVP